MNYYMRLLKRFHKGFSLIEILVVIAIVAVLSLIGYYSLQSIRIAGRDAKRLSDVQSLQSALLQYYQRNDAYPTLITAGQPLASPAGGATYLTQVPQNAKPYNDNGCVDEDYSYKAISGGASFILSTCIGKGDNGSQILVSTPKGVFRAPNSSSVGVWRLNGSGVALEQSDTSNQKLSFYGDPTPETDPGNCIQDTCLTLDSSIGQSIFSPVPQASDSYTIAFWFKPTLLRTPDEETYGDERQLFDSADDQVGISLLWNQGAANYRLHAWDGASLTTSFVPEIGTFYHIALASDGATMKLYVNGSLLASKAANRGLSAGTAVWGDASPSGQSPTRQSRYTDGTFDEMRIYTSALTASEINTLYLSGL